MGKYIQAETQINELIAVLQESTKVFPNGFEGDKGGPPYLRATIVPSGSGVNRHSVTGMLQIEIYTAWGGGPREATLMADTLDGLFQSKTSGTTQFFESTLGAFLQDRDDKSLGRSLYSLPFAHFGAQ